jgi:hypothetical protein
MERSFVGKYIISEPYNRLTIQIWNLEAILVSDPGKEEIVYFSSKAHSRSTFHPKLVSLCIDVTICPVSICRSMEAILNTLLDTWAFVLMNQSFSHRPRPN